MKNIRRELQEQFFLTHGMVHMAYHADQPEDVLSPYGSADTRILNTAFTGFVDQMISFLPPVVPIVLEISGADFSSEQQRVMENSIRFHYEQKLLQMHKAQQKQAVRMAWFLFSMILSSVLLFCVTDSTDKVTTQFAYLPFWFFGYRILDYLILQLAPQAENDKHVERLAAMEIMFTGSHPIYDVPEGQAAAMRASVARRTAELKANINHLNHHIRERRTAMYNILCKDGKAELTSEISSPEDILPPNWINGYELITDDFADYLEQSIPYLPPRIPVELKLSMPDIRAVDQERLTRAVHNHFRFRLADVQDQVNRCLFRIVFFGVALVISAILLAVGTITLDKAMLEAATMVFWFFGDYLIEFIILGLAQSLTNTRALLQLSDMNIVFSDISNK